MVQTSTVAEACFACSSSFSVVETQLGDRARSRELGKRFDKAYREVTDHKAGAIIRASIESPKEKQVTRDPLVANNEDLVAAGA